MNFHVLANQCNVGEYFANLLTVIHCVFGNFTCAQN